MRSKLILFAAVCVAALALSSSASAATILAFSQNSNVDFVNADRTGSTTTLNTNGGPGTTLSIPILITQIGNTPITPTLAFETFLPSGGSVSGLQSTAPGTGGVEVGFNGTILISAAPFNTGGGGQNILTAVIVNGRADANGAAGGFNASSFSSNGGNPTSVTLTSANPFVQIALGLPGGPTSGPVQGAVSLALVNITPPQAGSGFSSFTAQNTGNFSTVSAIPEPASFLSAGTAILAGLGCFGWSRRKSSKA
jgi:hypothetical protein